MGEVTAQPEGLSGVRSRLEAAALAQVPNSHTEEAQATALLSVMTFAAHEPTIPSRYRY